MKPSPFAYEKPSSLAEVLVLLDQHGDNAALLAGGQSLVATLNMRLSAPSILVDINGIQALEGIGVSGDTLRIGALSRHSELEGSAEVARHAPLIHRAMPHIGHPAIRNRGTFGGSIAFADPAAELPACLVALAGRIALSGPTGDRSVSAADFFKDLYETDRRPDEVVTAVEVPVIGEGYRPAFAELARRHGDYAMVGLAAHARADGATIANGRFVFFGVGSTPVVARAAAAALQGQPPGDATIVAAQAALESDLDPFDDINCKATTKMHLAKELLGRVARELVADGAAYGAC